ncbi:hypothetical protein AAFF_G00028660 [Aldrovandia affinis]|uniref:Uncharacterized protein n=1 Tax=Aldrovandia affinis TaxID=143900 RepID=A0AAD7WH49_9TELE|nr:hypothetical protein AAFF_G00028660 [Aldrovandia affinis]
MHQQSFPQGQPISKGAVQRERPLDMSQQLLMFAKQCEVPETQTSCGQTHTASTNRDLNADGQLMDFHSFGRAEDSARRPAGPRAHVKRHLFLERSTKPENIVTGAFNDIPLHGAAESESHLRSVGNAVLHDPHTWAASGMPTADHSPTKPVRPPPGFQPLQHLFPQLFPPPKMTLQPRLNPLQVPTGPPLNQMNFPHEVPSPFFLFLPGQPAMPILFPGNVLDPSCLTSGLSTVALPTSLQGHFSRVPASLGGF